MTCVTNGSQEDSFTPEHECSLSLEPFRRKTANIFGYEWLQLEADNQLHNVLGKPVPSPLEAGIDLPFQCFSRRHLGFLSFRQQKQTQSRCNSPARCINIP